MATPPVHDWTTDYDILDPEYVANPYPVWDDLREQCPFASSQRWGGSFMPTRYADVFAVAHDVETFSSRDVGVLTMPPGENKPAIEIPVPPIDSDPPDHTWIRRLLLPWFSHTRVAGYEPMTRDLCRGLVDGFIGNGAADGAADYAQQIPVRVIAHILGVPTDLADTFTGWVRDVLEFAHDPVRSTRGQDGITTFLIEQLAARREDPRDDLISALVQAENEGEPVPDLTILGMAALTLLAGVDTTWSAIGASLYHLATHPADAARLVGEPDLMPTAIEELLRAYSPVTMARVATHDTEYAGCPVKEGQKVLLNFAAANRDPEVFANPNEVIFDRDENRHMAFGSGIHRCAGANLARMELRVALEEWLARIPEFPLADDAEVTWAGGQVRGPRQLPLVFGS